MVLCLLVLLILAGFAGCLIAWRGRRIDDHPLCRRCGFDLTGRPEGNIVCGECGADLTAAKAIRIGHRRAAGGWLAISLIVLLIGSAGGGLDAVRVTRRRTWIQWMPVKYLLWKAQGIDPAERKQSLSELQNRAKDNLLSGSQWSVLIDVGLTRQGDRLSAWEPQWGDLIELGRQQKHVDDPRWDRYVAQAMVNVLVLRVRPKVRIGDPLPYWINCHSGRVGTSSDLKIHIESKTQDISGQAIKSSVSSTGGLTDNWETGTLVSEHLPGSAGAATLAVTIHCVAGESKIETRNDYSTVAPRFTTDMVLTQPFEMVPADQPTVRLLHDPTKQAAMKQALSVRPQMSKDGEINAMVELKSVPVPVSFEVVLIAQEKEAVLGHFAAASGSGPCAWGMGSSSYYSDPPASAATKKSGETVLNAKVIFRPDPTAAIDSLDLTDYWDGTVVLDQVPVVKE